MAHYLERLRVFALNQIYVIVLLGANLFAVLCMAPLYPLLRTDADFDVIEQASAGLR